MTAFTATRRAMLMGGITAGAALAVLPKGALAQTAT